eukprot:Hpha_TRINITY_DN29661_c0_g1::TRINITY_DN29661_c0_g1_i1::g.165155::m.165155
MSETASAAANNCSYEAIATRGRVTAILADPVALPLEPTSGSGRGFGRCGEDLPETTSARCTGELGLCGVPPGGCLPRVSPSGKRRPSPGSSQIPTCVSNPVTAAEVAACNRGHQRRMLSQTTAQVNAVYASPRTRGRFGCRRAQAAAAKSSGLTFCPGGRWADDGGGGASGRSVLEALVRFRFDGFPGAPSRGGGRDPSVALGGGSGGAAASGRRGGSGLCRAEVRLARGVGGGRGAAANGSRSSGSNSCIPPEGI